MSSISDYFTVSTAIDDDLLPTKTGNEGFWGRFARDGLQTALKEDKALHWPREGGPYLALGVKKEGNRWIMESDFPELVNKPNHLLWVDAQALQDPVEGLEIRFNDQSHFWEPHLPGATSSKLPAWAGWSRGRLFRRRDDKALPGGMSTRVHLTGTSSKDRAPKRPEEIQGMLNPLILKFRVPEPENSKRPRALSELYDRFRAEERLVDLIPVVPEDALLRGMWFAEIARRLQDSPSPMARLVRGGMGASSFLPYFILDGAGEPFLLRNFAGDGETAWQWLVDPERELPWWQNWALRRLGITRGARKGQVITRRLTDVGGWTGGRPCGTSEPDLDTLLRADNLPPILRWLGQRLEEGAELTEEADRVRDGLIRASRGGLWYPGRLLEVLGKDRLCPRSSLWVELPAPPDFVVESGRREWLEFRESHWVDLVQTPVCGEVRWLERVFSIGNKPEEPAAWNAGSHNWNYSFYRAVFERPWNFVPDWAPPRRPLGEFQLGRDRLGEGCSDEVRITDFELT